MEIVFFDYRKVKSAIAGSRSVMFLKLMIYRKLQLTISRNVQVDICAVIRTIHISDGFS